MNYKPYTINQSGAAQLIITLLLIAGIVLTTYLVGQKTHILPSAQENTCTYPQFCDAGGGANSGQQSCTGSIQSDGSCQYDPAVDPACSACEPISGAQNPLAQNPPGGTFLCSKEEADSGLPAQDCTKDGCSGKQYRTFTSYDDLNGDGQSDSGDNIYCSWSDCKDLVCPEGVTPPTTTQQTGQTQTCPDEGLIYCDNGKMIKKENARWNGSGCDYDFTDVTVDPNQCQDKGNGTVITAGTQTAISTTPQTSSCNEGAAINAYYNADVATNLLFYFAILKGTPNICVKADLGMNPHIYAHTQNSELDRRLILCSGGGSSPGNLELTWRVTGDDGQTLELTREDYPTDPNDPGWPNNENIGSAKQTVGISI